jgi:hypothetical protein
MIDVARWQYHFENGCPEAVLNALAKYQNEDGGFGHALEADSWNPNSTPIQTCTAAEILREINFADADHPIVAGMLNYLDSGADFNGKVWFNSVLTNNDYPHAPWWHTDAAGMEKISYNPTAALAGFGLAYANRKSELYEKCSVIAAEAVEHYLKSDRKEDMHTVQCYLRLMEYCESAEIYDAIDLNALREKLRNDINCLITADISLWTSNYICKPSLFFNSPKSIFYEQNQEIAEFECEFICGSRNPDGVWDLTWRWNDYPKEWAVAENWCKGAQAVNNMLYLSNFR